MCTFSLNKVHWFSIASFKITLKLHNWALILSIFLLLFAQHIKQQETFWGQYKHIDSFKFNPHLWSYLSWSLLINVSLLFRFLVHFILHTFRLIATEPTCDVAVQHTHSKSWRPTCPHWRPSCSFFLSPCWIVVIECSDRVETDSRDRRLWKQSSTSPSGGGGSAVAAVPVYKS